MFEDVNVKLRHLVSLFFVSKSIKTNYVSLCILIAMLYCDFEENIAFAKIIYKTF